MLPVFVRDISKPADGRENLVKYVEFTGTQPGVCQYIEMETSLVLEHLKEKEPTNNLQRVLDKMMLVKFKESKEEHILEIFQRGIYCDDPVKRYNFLGHSREQLKEKMCLLVRESPEHVYDILDDFAAFQQVEPVDKRADQIGALFSCFGHNVKLEADEYDVSDAGKMLRGAESLGRGCGLISHALCGAVKDVYHLPLAPNLVQVRYQAYQGVLLKHHDQYMRSKATFTKSMEMFQVPPSSVTSFSDLLAVVDYSKPYSMGYLDTLSVMMLEERGVKPEYLARLQECYYEILEKITQDDDRAKTWFMYNIGEIDVATKLQSKVTASIQEAREEVAEIHHKEVRKMKEGTFKDSDGEEMQNYRILVLKSREVLGVHDPYSHLKSNECFFNPTLPNDRAMEEFELAENLLIMHRPCYNPDHICSLKLVHKSDRCGVPYEDIQDCLVLGGPSAVDKCNGGAPGDKSKFFVSWDKNLLPSAFPAPTTARLKSFLSTRVAVPTCMQWDFPPNLARCSRAFSKCLELCGSKPSLADEVRRKTEQRSKLLNYFASFKDVFSQTRELFMKYASSDGPSSDRCRRLSDLLCGGIDPYTQREEAERVIKEVQPTDNEGKNPEEIDAEEPDESAQPMQNAAVGQVNSQKKVWRSMGERAANFRH